MKNVYKSNRIPILLLSLLLLSCNKFLEEKPLKTLVVPATLEDLLALLDFHVKMNEFTPILNDLLCDDYYVTDDKYRSQTENDRMNHIWDKAAVYNTSWVYPYQNPIYYANVVLSHVDKVSYKKGQQALYNYVKGAALFYRAFSFERLAQLYCRPYSHTSATDPGIVLRLSTEIEAASRRATVAETYSQIIADLKLASELLPVSTPYPTQPTKAAAYGTLARTYLWMRDYDNAGSYANLSLLQYSALMDYNQLVPVQAIPIKRFNKETVFYNHADYSSMMGNAVAIIDTNLYRSYHDNDLRKQVFFRQVAPDRYTFQGCYDGNYSPDVCFDGITTGEMYLIRAEAFARQEDTQKALKDLNTLLEKRWQSSVFVPLATGSAEEALQQILEERRKELVYRGLRWSDLRRLNEEGANITLKRVIEGVTYELPPQDPRWVMLIPAETMNYANISQNPR